MFSVCILYSRYAIYESFVAWLKYKAFVPVAVFCNPPATIPQLRLVPLVVKPQLEVEFEFITEAEGFSASAIRRLWAYFTRLNKGYFNYPLNDSPT